MRKVNFFGLDFTLRPLHFVLLAGSVLAILVVTTALIAVIGHGRLVMAQLALRIALVTCEKLAALIIAWRSARVLVAFVRSIE